MVELVPALGVDHPFVVASAGGLTEAARLLVLVFASQVALGQVSPHNFSEAGKNNKCLQNCFH